MRVLMVSPHFPPDSAGGTHRVRLLAPRLREHGWEPTVLTVDARDYDGALDPDLAAAVPADLRVVRARAWPSRLTRLAGIGDLGLRAFEGLWREASQLLARERYDALFVTIYPAYTAMLGPLLKRRYRVPFVLDYQDPWVGEWGRSAGPRADGRPDVRSRASRWIATRMEPIALRAADAVTAVSSATFEPALRRNPRVSPRATAALPIGWDPRDFERLGPRAARTAGEAMRLACIGTLAPTMTATLDAVFTALTSLRDDGDSRVRRLRIDFIGTSNQRAADAAPRALASARAHGVADVVTETPGRLNYFDTLAAFRDADALLLLGSSEAHYTPSRIYAALNSERPILAIYHADSPVTDLLRRFGAAPSVRLITYSDARPLATCVDDIRAALRDLASCPIFDARAVDKSVLCEASASTLAGRLADVLALVSAPAGVRS